MIMPREKREIQKEDIIPLDVYTEKRRELRKNIVDSISAAIIAERWLNES